VSRIGKIPVTIPINVKVVLSEHQVQVQGPRGTLSIHYNDKVKVDQEGDQVYVRRLGETKEHKASHGLYQRIISNMVKGVMEGYRKELEIVGVGYRAQMEGNVLTLLVGMSHQPKYPVPEGIKILVPKPTQIIIEGNDKQQVGQAAADIRKIRPPEPYKGKGIRYLNEKIRRKVGKTGTK